MTPDIEFGFGVFILLFGVLIRETDGNAIIIYLTLCGS